MPYYLVNVKLITDKHLVLTLWGHQKMRLRADGEIPLPLLPLVRHLYLGSTFSLLRN